MDAATGITAAQILGFSVTSGVVTFLLNWGLSSYRDRSTRKLETEHVALRVALALEKYAIACGTALSDAGTYRASMGGDGAPISRLPDLQLPATVEWKRLDHILANKVLSFENTIDYANGAISFELGYNSPDERCEQGELQAGYCGYRAVMLAQDLRAWHGLPPLELPCKWDYRKFLKVQHDTYVAMQVEYPE